MFLFQAAAGNGGGVGSRDVREAAHARRDYSIYSPSPTSVQADGYNQIASTTAADSRFHMLPSSGAEFQPPGPQGAQFNQWPSPPDLQRAPAKRMEFLPPGPSGGRPGGAGGLWGPPGEGGGTGDESVWLPSNLI